VIGAGAVSFADQAGKGNVDRELLGAHAWGKPGKSVRQDIYKLDSIPGGPYKATVGHKVELDGSASKPKKKIKSYEWSFQSDCPDGVQGKSSTKKGKTTKIVAICDTTAFLTVSDSQGREIDTDTAQINVKNKLKKMKFNQPSDIDGKLMPFGTDIGTYYFGANRCDKEPFDLNEADHWIHKPDDGELVKAKQVDDPGGPYDGLYYVTDHNLIVTRHMYINSQLLGGRVSQIEGQKQKALNKVIASTSDHERIHGELVQKIVEGKKQMKFLEDLAKAVDTSEEGLQKKASDITTAGETELQEASSESKVQAKMKKIYRDKKGNLTTATILRPTDNQPFTYTLALIGDVETDASPTPTP
jgi:hypothetical protein